jgi:beta-lactamase regulating signal transducer with metallopeptidase domain
MNAIGLSLLAVAARGTALVVVGLVIGWALRRRGPAASASLRLAVLVGMVGIAGLAATPWPRWEWPSPGSVGGEARPRESARDITPEAGAPPAQGIEPLKLESAPPKETGLVAVLRTLGQALASPAPAVEGKGWRWPAGLAAVAIAGVAFGLGRLALGLAAVAALRSGSRRVDDPGLLELAEAVRGRIGVRRPVGLRVAPGLAMPATVGWLRPLILLPEDWTGWDAAERRAVLAHEMAHVGRGDYLAGVWAQVCLALQFYHPLAHWLAWRFRLDQELAADAWGAQLAGGHRPYLAALARLALRNDPSPVGWAARSFSPARGTFLRRIEMLRDARDLAPSPLSRRSRAVVLGCLALVGLALAGLRGPAPIAEAFAAPQPQGPQEGTATMTIDRGFIPADAGMIAVLRPAELMGSPDLRRLIESFVADRHFQDELGITPAEIEQVTLIWLQGDPHRDGRPSGVVLRAANPRDWKAVATRLAGEGARESRFGEFSYMRSTRGGDVSCVATPDDRTLLMAEESSMLRLLAARPGAADRASWIDVWKGVKKGQVAVALDTSWLAVKLQPVLGARPAGVNAPGDAVAPLLSQAHSYAIGIDLLHDLRVDGLAACNTEPGAGQVADTLKALIVFGRNSFAALLGERQASRSQPVALGMMADVAQPLLEKAQVTTEGRNVRVSATIPFQPGQAVAALAPAVQAQRAATKRVQSVNNLKQIGLAMHNYADTHGGRFPAATMIGPDGKTPHSWRVAILPYIEQQELYSQYRFDEPWDGPNNRKLLDKMPALYAHPDAKGGSMATYFMPTGPHTISSDNQGTALVQIADGTSNTIAVVEARRDIPWTKPDDIPVAVGPGAEGQPVPKLGGFSPEGFNALFGDGSVRFISEKVNPDVLKALLSRDGGEVIAQEALNR